ncbi:DUF4254 domain-containing protein [Fulvivirgaceae bacterium BMA10]|uniref:DUF4254 domain-containing protein n=1 Tax=Splendidivirga corallicola TaxID=3051826 RepID=A0ABT8KIH8_9BACT|nr:DUF4254 domain-containing protein [Fulvivirgaceae bacterium BMA10]
MNAQHCLKIFNQSIIDYHKYDSVEQAIENPYDEESIDGLLYLKNWIDTVQWHYEDLIREPHIDASEAVKLKRLIDASNQRRTDLVEKIDDWFVVYFKDSVKQEGSKLNTETPAWALDRLSILALKIYHMQEQVDREDTATEHKASCEAKLAILNEQKADLSKSIDELLEDIKNGTKYMKVYRQMKMYNDPSLNPVLYSKKQN